MKFQESIQEAIKLKNELLKEEYQQAIENISQAIVEALKSKKKVLTAGNGGSAADAQHMAAELAGKFLLEKEAIPAVALTANSSVITALANDFGYQEVFARQVESLGEDGDVFLAISTSGQSENLVQGLKKAREKGLKTVGLLGQDGGQMKDYCDLSLVVPSQSTPRIQEVHILIIHLICAVVDEAFAK